MYLEPAQITFIQQEVLKEYPKEAVFAVIAPDNVIKLDNIHSEPNDYFAINEAEFDSLNAIALIHSHTYNLRAIPDEFHGRRVDFRMPSQMDMKAQMLLDIEFGILSCDGTCVSEILWYPDLDAEMLGQEYISGVHDCYSIIRRYYWQNYKVLLDENPRDFLWFESNPNKYAEDFKKFGWYEVSLDQIEPGDMLIIRIGHYESHSGMYIGDGQFIHHLTDQLSRREDISKWLKRITRVTRHKDKPKK